MKKSKKMMRFKRNDKEPIDSGIVLGKHSLNDIEMLGGEDEDLDKELNELRYYKTQWQKIGGAANLQKLVNDFEKAKEALEVAANQLEGVSLALQKLGNNISVPFFIAMYNEFSGKARKVLSDIK